MIASTPLDFALYYQRQVLADERFLHVVKGEPSPFLMTFAAAPPGG